MSFIHTVFAAEGVNIGDPKVWPLATEFKTLGDLVSRLLPIALILGGIVFFVMVIFAGFGILSGAGSEDAAAKAKWHQILTYGAVGLIIMFSAYWIVQIISYVTGNSLGGLFGNPKP